MNATLGQSSFPTALLSLDSSIPLVLSPPGSQQPKMSELNNIIANYSHVLENSHATLRACEEFERDRARIENLIPLRVHRNRTEYSTLSAEDLVKHKESLFEGIFDDHVFGQVRSKLSYEASEVTLLAPSPVPQTSQREPYALVPRKPCLTLLQENLGLQLWRGPPLFRSQPHCPLCRPQPPAIISISPHSELTTSSVREHSSCYFRAEMRRRSGCSI